jgi:hypothetical protein
MDVLGWLWWAVVSVVSLAASLVWFLISGWVSTLLQIALLIAVIYYFKYGWQRAPAEIWRHTMRFGRFFWSWLRASEPQPDPRVETREVVRVVRAKDFGDINLSTLMSLAMLSGLLILAHV